MNYFKGVYCLLFLLSFLMTAGPLPAAHAAKDEGGWTEISSPHFILRSDASEEEVAKIVADLERFRVALGQVTLLDFSVSYEKPLLIYAYKKLKDYRKISSAKGSLGFYSRGLEQAHVFLSLENEKEEWRASGLEVLFHEYTHHLIRQYSQLQYPRWYEEGFAEYVSTIKIEGKRIVLGDLVLERAVALKNYEWLPLQRIIQARGNYLSGKRNGVPNNVMQYAQGWLLVHYVQTKPVYRERLAQFLVALNRSTEDAVMLFNQIMGISVEEMEKELELYWRREGFLALTIETKSVPEAEQLTVRKMSKSESDLQKIEAAYLRGRIQGEKKKAKEITKQKQVFRENFEKALQENIRPQDMHWYLANMAVTDQEFTAAEEHISSLKGLDADHSRAFLLEAWLVKSGGRSVENLVQEERAYLRQSIRQNRAYAHAYYRLAETYLRENTELAEETFIVAETLRSLRPNDLRADLIYGRLLLKAGRYDEFIGHIDHMLAWAREPQLGENLERLRAMVQQ